MAQNPSALVLEISELLALFGGGRSFLDRVRSAGWLRPDAPRAQRHLVPEGSIPLSPNSTLCNLFSLSNIYDSVDGSSSDSRQGPRRRKGRVTGSKECRAGKGDAPALKSGGTTSSWPHRTVASGGLEIDVFWADDRVELCVRGDVDVATSRLLREQTLVIAGRGISRLVCDLRSVSFMDASGLAVLVGAQKRAASAGGAVTLVCDNPHILRLLRLTGLDRVFEIRPSLDETRQLPHPR